MRDKLPTIKDLGAWFDNAMEHLHPADRSAITEWIKKEILDRHGEFAKKRIKEYKGEDVWQYDYWLGRRDAIQSLRGTK